MITIGYNQVQEKHATDGSGAASEAKKVYVGNKLAHVHVNDNTEFALRQTLNGYIHEDNDLYAKVRSIYGNTKVWNQLVQNGNFSDGTNGWTVRQSNSIISISDGIELECKTGVSIFPALIQSISFTKNHKYYVCFYHKKNDCSITSIKLSLATSWQASATEYIKAFTTTTWSKTSDIVTCTTDDKNKIYIEPTNYTNDNNNIWYINNVVIIDLTLIYGAGNEPTTVAEFEADFQQWFGRPVGAEPYDAGSLIPFLGTGIKSTGFNLWDEEWEEGIYDLSTGEKVSYADRVRCKNMIPVNPSTHYYIKNGGVSGSSYFGWGLLYDSNGNLIKSPFGGSNNYFSINNVTITTPSNAAYLTFYLVSTSTYNNDICINLSNPTLNGTYVPYKATTVPIPVTTLTGKQSGSGTSEVIFPDGMKLAGSIKDEVYVEDGKTYAEKKVDSRAYVSGDENDTTVVTDGHSTTYYELATPIVYEVDNYTLPLYYVANGTGTEEIQSTSTSAPADMDIEYRLRQRVRLVDMGTPGVLWADSDIDITKPDGFCDSPFTYDKSFFSWGNVVGHNPISNTAFDYDWGGINQAEPWYEGQAYGSTPGNTLTGNIPTDAQYDAAKAILGGNWRMPSNAEFGNLFSVCKFLETDGSNMDTSKTDKRVDMPDGNGGTVKGIYIESTVTGNRLFFSCSGNGNGRSWNNRGSNGNYWSSTWNSARNARSLYFRSGGVNPQSNDSRYLGFALRPVFPISQ